ncbi:MAG TPA: response regulator [Polyangiaceae bacterium]|nr:response regulator [Polyangiaceae bacterium]
MSQQLLRVLIADDEALARQRLVRLLAGLPRVKLSAECANGNEVLRVLATKTDERPDILLLDIRMPELSGLETCALLQDDAPYVIFTTAYSEHAVEAFDVGADDYLLKPIEAARLKRALDRARLRLEPVSALTAPERSPTLGRLPVQTSRGIVLLGPHELSHAELAGPLLNLHTSRGTFLADFSLQHLQDALPDPRFWRVHRRALVNLDYVERLESVESGGYVAHMQSGARIPVSRQAGRRLRRALGLPV